MKINKLNNFSKLNHLKNRLNNAKNLHNLIKYYYMNNIILSNQSIQCLYFENEILTVKIKY